MASASKYAVLSVDLEDWYHLDYLRDKPCDRAYSMLDGLDEYRRILESHDLPSSFFVVGEIAQSLSTVLRELADAGHDVGGHGWSHVRPLTMGVDGFASEVSRSKMKLEDILGRPVIGYRAPCFSLDRQRLEIVRDVGYSFDSSRIRFGDHPLYGDLNLDGFTEVSPAIYSAGDFFEFEVSTLTAGRKQLPVAGGAYLRILPWIIMKRLLERYLRGGSLFTLYVHPFELSSRSNPDFPAGTTNSDKLRFALGRSSVARKLNALIEMVRDHGYEFTTFSILRDKLISETS